MKELMTFAKMVQLSIMDDLSQMTEQMEQDLLTQSTYQEMRESNMKKVLCLTVVVYLCSLVLCRNAP